jgi:transposase
VTDTATNIPALDRVAWLLARGGRQWPASPSRAHARRSARQSAGSALLSALLPQTMLLADRGYKADWIREFVRQKEEWENIPPKRNRILYRARNLVERFFNKIKQCRRVANRCDKPSANYLAFIKLASIRIWLRANESML